MDNFDATLKEFREIYDRLWIPTTEGGISSIGALYGTLSIPSSIRVSALTKNVLDVLPDEFMGVSVTKRLGK